MADTKPIKMGTRVEVIGKGVVGTVAYIGTTMFSSGMAYLPYVCINVVNNMANTGL